MSTPPLLSLRGIDKAFPGVTALVGASLEVRAGTVHAVLGENGAGKTTLMRVAAGLLRPDGGEVRLDGRLVRLASSRDAVRLGVGMVHQHFSLVPALTVAENVALGGTGRYDARGAARRVRALGSDTGLEVDPAALPADLPVSAQQRVEVLRAIARAARLLILDEPTAVLSPDDATSLLRWMRRFADAGHAAVLITHKLPEALAVADRITVLRQGRTVSSGPRADADAGSLALAMLGGVGGQAPVPTRGIPGDPVVRAEALTVSDARGVERLRRATFDVRAAEIVGVAGVEGSGQRELLRAVAGRTALRAGQLETPRDVAFIPEDRQREALLLDASLTENIALRGAGRRRGVMNWAALRLAASRLLERFAIGAPSPETPVRHLSGGTQQRLVLARELDGSPSLVVAEHPTRGLDVRATAAVHERLRSARSAGAAILVSGSDLDEIVELADRVLVLYAGRVIPCPAERAAVGRAMVGLA